MRKIAVKIIKWILAIILYLVAIYRILNLDFIKFPILNFDTISICLIFISTFILIFPWIIKQISKINFKLISRHLVVSFCLGLAILQMFFKQLSIGESSIYLIIIAAIGAYIPDIKELIYRIRKFKKGDFELEMELSQLIDKAEKVGKKIEEEEKPDKVKYAGINEDTLLKIFESACDPRVAILVISAEIDNRIVRLAESANVIEGNKKYSPLRLLRLLGERGIVDYEAMNIYGDFREIRHQVAHGWLTLEDSDSNTLYRMVELGLRILRLLPTEVLSS